MNIRFSFPLYEVAFQLQIHGVRSSLKEKIFFCQYFLFGWISVAAATPLTALEQERRADWFVFLLLPTGRSSVHAPACLSFFQAIKILILM